MEDQNNDRTSQKLSIPLDKVIAFHPILAKVFGGIESAIYWQQLYYWSDKGCRKDGFIWKTQEEIKDETTLSREKQDLIRKKMIAKGFIEVKKIKANGVPTLHYKVLVTNVQKAIEEYTNGNVGFTQMEVCGSHKSLTEITTEITTESISKDIGNLEEEDNLNFKDNLKNSDSFNDVPDSEYISPPLSRLNPPKEYGNKDINNVMYYLQKRLGLPMLDGTIKSNRQYAFNIIRKYGGLKPVLAIIDIVAEDDFWRNKVTSVRDLYYKGVKIVAGKRQTGLVSVKTE